MSRATKKSETRQRILAAAGRSFRRGGYGGVGVDGLAKEAGVTSGAFYVHFDSKASAFCEAIVDGVSAVGRAVRQLQTEHPLTWWAEFVRFYLGPKRRCDLSESCGLQSLTPEVARADPESRSIYESELLAVIRTIASGPPSPGAPRDVASATAALAMLIGAVSLARAVPDASIADKIALRAQRALLPAESGKRAKPGGS